MDTNREIHSFGAARADEPRRPRVAVRRARVREELLAVGARLFVAEGIENISVEDVIAKANIARSTFYTFFTSKRDLLLNIVAPVFTTGIAAFDALAGKGPRELMTGMIDAYLLMWERHGEALLLSTRIPRADFAMVEAIHRRYVDALTRLLVAVHPSGELRNESVEYTRKLIAKSAVDILLVYRNDPSIRALYHATMEGMLLKDPR